jgi:DNA-binding helix-hairpin-helix protein with protein kinase domain
MKLLVTSEGTAVQLGRELGRGGEGAVYETPTLPKQVAKLYLAPPDAKKQAKLSFMADVADSELLKYVAWPQETLHAHRGGPVVGFLMPKISGRDAIHMIYSPAHRRQNRPKLAWDFLLFVARNTAAAFETLHARGHVLGDVNQGNVLVGNDSQVALIDSDSFQVQARGVLHMCEVGVSHFTPPELQGIPSFHGVTRTANHDNFGLAVLIFHLLFGGRHPYSGVPLRQGVADALETDIKAFRYAYARDSQSRGIAPPPKSISASMLPDAVESMFHQAFTERGVSSARPTASQWVRSLDALRQSLRKCSASTVHVYPHHLARCPWCGLEQQGVVYFIDLVASYTPTATGFALVQAWARITAVPAPPPVTAPSPSGMTAAARPVPAGAESPGSSVFATLTLLAAVSMFFIFPQAWLLWGIVVWISWTNMTPADSPARAAERRSRQAALSEAERTYQQLVDRLKREAGPEGFLAKKAELEKLRIEYEQLSAMEAKEVDHLKSTAHERQKQKFLDGCFIETADITGVGPARKAALRSFGIETAADVSRHSVMQVRGFGPCLTRAVLDWRASCERRFTFNPATAFTEADRLAVRTKFAARRRAIEGILTSAPAELQQFVHGAGVCASQLRPQLEQAAKGVAQAKADLAAM